jgi:hypothetical protein
MRPLAGANGGWPIRHAEGIVGFLLVKQLPAYDRRNTADLGDLSGEIEF